MNNEHRKNADKIREDALAVARVLTASAEHAANREGPVEREAIWCADAAIMVLRLLELHSETARALSVADETVEDLSIALKQTETRLRDQAEQLNRYAAIECEREEMQDSIEKSADALRRERDKARRAFHIAQATLAEVEAERDKYKAESERLRQGIDDLLGRFK